MCAFDVVANNADRKSGHVLKGSDGRLWGIDHGLCFHRQPKLRTVIWDFADEPLPDRLLADLGRGGLGPARRGGLPAVGPGAGGHPAPGPPPGRDAGSFPNPIGDRPPYPWPLV